MMRKMVNGLPLPFPTQNTRDHGSKRYDGSFNGTQADSNLYSYIWQHVASFARKSRTRTTRVNGRHLWLTIQVCSPEFEPCIRLLFGYWVISIESNCCASQISRMIHTFMHLTAWSTLALSCGRLVLDSRIFLSRSERHHSWLILLFFYVQVKSGTLFDNIIITDDPALAKTFAEETWGKHKEVCFSSL